MKGIVYISNYLNEAEYGKTVASELKKKLHEKSYKIIEIENHSKNVWCRDYMPIVSNENKLFQFKYAPGYMTNSKKWRQRIPDPLSIRRELNLDVKNESEIILDGGAIEICGKTAIISDRIMRENPIKPDILLKQIKELLDLERIIVVPQYPYDFTGHVDGMVRFIDNSKVLINDLSEEMELLNKNEKEKKNTYRCKLVKNWYYSFLMTFHNAGLKVEVLPSNYANNESDKYGNGIYLNFMKLPDLIVMPSYNNMEFDNLAKVRLKELYKREVINIDASKLAKEGGMINCVTWIDQYNK